MEQSTLPSRTTREKLSDILLAVSWREIAHHYFDRSASWIYHKIDERDVNKNGKPYKFTDQELERLKESLRDLALRLNKVADSL